MLRGLPPSLAGRRVLLEKILARQHDAGRDEQASAEADSRSSLQARRLRPGLPLSGKEMTTPALVWTGNAVRRPKGGSLVWATLATPTKEGRPSGQERRPGVCDRRQR